MKNIKPNFNYPEFGVIKYGRFVTIKGIEFTPFEMEEKNEYTFKRIEFDAFKNN